MKRIRIIIAYFGSVPPWHALFMESVLRNPTIDVLIFCDAIEWQTFATHNVAIRRISFNEFLGLLRSRLGHWVNASSPYKLCDFRPAWGEVFREELTDYDFWGYGDVDVIWGNLRNFLTEPRLATFDKLLRRGHLTITRNVEPLNRLYQCDGGIDWRTAFETPHFVGFDEGHGLYPKMRKSGLSCYDSYCVADIRPTSLNFSLTKEDFNRKAQKFAWIDGRVFQEWPDDNLVATREFCYIHFQKRDMPVKLDLETMRQAGMWISGSGFTKRPKVVTAKALVEASGITVGQKARFVRRQYMWALKRLAAKIRSLYQRAN